MIAEDLNKLEVSNYLQKIEQNQGIREQFRLATNERNRHETNSGFARLRQRSRFLCRYAELTQATQGKTVDMESVVQCL